MRLTVSALVLVCLSGCGFAPTLVKHPDAPVLVVQSKGKYVKVAPYSKEGATLLGPEWVLTSEYVGWTLTKYDWEARALRDAVTATGRDTDAGVDGESVP